MKKISFVLGIMAFTLAIATAFTFRPSNLVSPGFTDGQNGCKRATAECNGDNQNCQVDIPEVPGTGLVTIKDFDSNCATVLQME
ncbi:MAG: DUF6520 family protein [Cyclobacteriaceae bacterium]